VTIKENKSQIAFVTAILRKLFSLKIFKERNHHKFFFKIN